MKAITFLCFLFSLPLSIQAQAILEHTYPTTDLHRVHWTSGGEHYWFSNDSLKEIKVYSAQHQLIKTIRYPSVSNSQVRLLKSEQAVTQSTVNADNLLEMVWFFKDTLTKKEQVKIVNEKDSVLFVFSSLVDTVIISEVEGLPKAKLFVVAKGTTDTTLVYSLPNIQLEKTYPNVRYLHRKKFGYAGEKYFYKQSSGKKLQIYNADHSYYKSIKLDWFPRIIMGDDDPYLDADDNVFSKDSLIEVIFSYGSGDDSRRGIMQEGNKKLLYKSSYPFRIDHQKELTDKLFIDTCYSNSINTYRYCRVYSLPSFQKELKIGKSSFPWQRTSLKKYGETFFTLKTWHSLNIFYNNNLNSKTINLFTSFDIVYPSSIMNQIGFPIISDSIINKDSLIDVIYAEYNYINKINTTKIINEKGFIYNTIDSTKYFSINQSPTLSPKLITKTGNDKPYDTKVWRFNTTTPTKEAPSVLETKIYPNPFSKSITIETQENTVFPLKIRLINALGEVVFATKTNESKTDLALPNLTKGVYFLELMDENKRTVQEIVKMD